MVLIFGKDEMEPGKFENVMTDVLDGIAQSV
jgi:hypothetical protein